MMWKLREGSTLPEVTQDDQAQSLVTSAWGGGSFLGRSCCGLLKVILRPEVRGTLRNKLGASSFSTAAILYVLNLTDLLVMVGMTDLCPDGGDHLHFAVLSGSLTL